MESIKFTEDSFENIFIKHKGVEPSERFPMFEVFQK